MAAYWSTQALGCIERDTFQLHPVNRTTLTQKGGPPVRSKKTDVAAPITASIQTHQTRAQWTAFTQWHRIDLSGGAKPFYIDLWLWNRTRRVRARFVGSWRSQRELFDSFTTQATIEIERESLT